MMWYDTLSSMRANKKEFFFRRKGIEVSGVEAGKSFGLALKF